MYVLADEDRFLSLHPTWETNVGTRSKGTELHYVADTENEIDDPLAEAKENRLRKSLDADYLRRLVAIGRLGLRCLANQGEIFLGRVGMLWCRHDKPLSRFQKKRSSKAIGL